MPFGLPAPKTYLVSQHVDLERTWWRLFQRHVVRTKFDIYVFIMVFNKSFASMKNVYKLKDPKNVFDQLDISLLINILFFSGLFRNVIIQSGSPFAQWAVRERPSLPDVYYNIFTSAFGCLSNKTLDVKLCLQSVSSEEMFRMTSGGHSVSSNYL